MIINLKRFKTMAKDAKSAAIKSRETKLSRKSHEELIQIILRKDKTERNLNAQIVNLKAEVNNLTTRIGNCEKDMYGTSNSLAEYKDKLSAIREVNTSLNIRFNELKEKYDKKSVEVVNLTNAKNIWKSIAIAAFVIFVSSLLLL